MPPFLNNEGQGTTHANTLQTGFSPCLLAAKLGSFNVFSRWHKWFDAHRVRYRQRTRLFIWRLLFCLTGCRAPLVKEVSTVVLQRQGGAGQRNKDSGRIRFTINNGRFAKHMKAALLFAALVMSTAAVSQSPDALKYAPRPILLMGSNATEEGVMPMLLTTDGVQHLEYVPISRIKEFADHGGMPIRLGDVLSALGEATQNISKLQEDNARLQAENEKLWKVAMKDAPRPQPPTVVVQQSAPAQPSALEKYMLLRSLIPAPRPYQLPMPVNPNANRLKTNCTTNAVGSTTYTNCN